MALEKVIEFFAIHESCPELCYYKCLEILDLCDGWVSEEAIATKFYVTGKLKKFKSQLN
jgi:hypothetical protein